MLRQADIPVVEIMDVDGQPVDCAVGISHRRAGRKMAEAIIEAGYRRIGFMGTKMPLDHRARKRLKDSREHWPRLESKLRIKNFTLVARHLAKGAK